jgi:hypothetical protein
VELTAEIAAPSASIKASRVRAAAFRSKPLIFENASSILGVVERLAAHKPV